MPLVHKHLSAVEGPHLGLSSSSTGKGTAARNLLFLLTERAWVVIFHISFCPLLGYIQLELGRMEAQLLDGGPGPAVALG